MIAPQEELAASHEKMKQELEEAKKEVARYENKSYIFSMDRYCSNAPYLYVSLLWLYVLFHLRPSFQVYVCLITRRLSMWWYESKTVIRS